MILRLKPHFLAKHPREVYENLIQVVNNNLSYLHQYVNLRKVFQLDQVQIFDMYVPLVADYTLTVSYEKPQQTLLEGLTLGARISGYVEKGFASRWIDV